MSCGRPFKSGRPTRPPPLSPLSAGGHLGLAGQPDRGGAGALTAKVGDGALTPGAGSRLGAWPSRASPRQRMREPIWAPLPLLLLLLPPQLWGGPPDSPRPEPQRELGPLQPFDLLYASGVAAYYSEDYEQAVRDLEAALRSHRRLREVRARCARHCAARRPLAPPVAGPAAELPFFRALLERARCYRSCQSQRLGGPASRHRVSEDVRSDFQRRVPYNYLQRAYIKVRRAHS